MNELEKISPQLSKIKKENPFGTPDKYFDDFSARLQMKLEQEKKGAPIRQNRFVRFLKPALGLAASFALIFTLVYWPLNTFLSGNIADNTLQIEQSDLEFETMLEGIDENSFYTLLEGSNGTASLTDEDLESYLVANVSEYEIFNQTSYN